MNADLHCHSTASDGTLAPRELAARAAANGVELWALTDHDVLSGLDEASAEAERWGMRFIAGVEISVTWSWQTIHIVGLNVDPASAELIGGLLAVRSSRRARAEKIAAQLAEVGIDGALEGAYRFTEDPDVISRTHFARYLVESGHVRDVKEVFKNYLVSGKPGFVPHHWSELSEALHWIKVSGGVPVMAHPGRYHYPRATAA